MKLTTKESNEEVSCYLAVLDAEYANRKNILSEAFRGETDDKNIMFPKGLGAQHPFNFEQVDKILNNVGIANALIDKIVDMIIGDFDIKTKDENAQAILNTLVDDTNLKSKLRPWIKEAISKGNGFMELDLADLKNIEKLRVLNANNMYVRRTKKGKVLGYNQFSGKIKMFQRGKPIPFTPKEIAHLTINKTPGDPYGIGLLWPNRATIENYAGSEVDRHKLLTRKAGAPIHVKLGVPGQKIKKSDLKKFKTDLQFMNNSTEWVTDANTEMNIIDFSGIGDNLTKSSEHDLEQLALGMNLPMSIVGISNNPEGLAKVNDKGVLRFIHSLRIQIEEIIEDRILRPFLRIQSPKLDSKVEFIWELAGEDEKIARLTIIKDALGLFDISPEMRAALEIEYAEIMELDVVDKLPTPEEARKKADEDEKELKDNIDQARKAEENIKQPEVPGAKKTATQKARIELQEIVKKVGNKYCVISHKTGKSLGCYPTKAQAEKRLKQIKRFSDKKEELISKLKPTITESEKNNMRLSQYVNVKELAGFNYSDYLVKILQNLRIDKFEDLLATNEQGLLEGLLPQKDVNKLRIILKDGFRKNKTIKQIEKDIDRSINLKDRVRFEDGVKKVTLSAEKRPINIARTETVRLANQGLKDLYLENKIKSYRWLTALDERTCPICEALDGQVFETRDGEAGVNMPPAHSMCRCSMVGLVD